MLSLTVNGESVKLLSALTLHQLLTFQHMQPNRVAVVINGHVVPKGQWHTHACNDGDVVDIFSVVAGG